MFIRQYLRRWPFSCKQAYNQGKGGGGGFNERGSWEGANKNARLFARKKRFVEGLALDIFHHYTMART